VIMIIVYGDRLDIILKKHSLNYNQTKLKNAHPPINPVHPSTISPFICLKRTHTIMKAILVTLLLCLLAIPAALFSSEQEQSPT